MPSMPQVTGPQAVRAFGRAGFEQVRMSGSHAILRKKGHPYVLSVPVHGNKPLGVGLLNKLIKDAGLTQEEFIALL